MRVIKNLGDFLVKVPTPYGQQRFKKKIWLHKVLQAILRLFLSGTFSSQINVLEDISYQKYAILLDIYQWRPCNLLGCCKQWRYFYKKNF